MKSYRPARRAKRALVSACAFELLETRSMLSVVNVANYGAHPNDGVNDLPAIQAAINASKPGDTILFDGGTFNLSGFSSASGGNGLMLLANRTYQGTNGATLSGHDTNGPQLSVVGDNVTITGLTFNGGGIKVDGNNAMAQNISIDSNTFNLNTGGPNNNGITMDSGLRNSSITNNYFTGYTGTFGIYGYNYNGLTIANNEFVNITAGIHIDAFGGCGNLLVEQNYLTGIRGMGMEFQTQGGTQPTSSNLVFQDNWYENPNLSSNASQNTNSMAFSLILDKGANITIQRNVVIDPQRPDGIGTRIGFEVGGNNTLVQDNYINGVNQTVAVNDGDGPCSVTVQNNQFLNYRQAAGISFPAANRIWSNINNGPNTTLSATMQNRIATDDTPGIGAKRYASTTTGSGSSSGSGTSVGTTTGSGSVTPTPPAISLPTVPAESDVTYLSDLDWTSMVNGWGPAELDTSNGEKASGDGKTITLNGVTYAKGLGVHAGSNIHYNLGGNYSEFLSDIGVDDEVGNNGSVDFQVYLDGKLSYDSSKMTGSSATQTLDLNVAGVQDLDLVVTNAGNGNNFDHADWANARLFTAAPAVTPPTTSVVNLSSLTPAYQTSGWGPIELNTSNGETGAGDGHTITLNGVTYATGIGVHANSILVFNLNGQYSTFSSDVGIDDEVGSLGSVQFRVLVDGATVFNSGTMTGSSATQTVHVDVTGKQQLILIASSPTSSVDFDHADWAGATLTTSTANS